MHRGNPGVALVLASLPRSSPGDSPADSLGDSRGAARWLAGWEGNAKIMAPRGPRSGAQEP